MLLSLVVSGLELLSELLALFSVGNLTDEFNWVWDVCSFLGVVYLSLRMVFSMLELDEMLDVS